MAMCIMHLQQQGAIDSVFIFTLPVQRDSRIIIIIIAVIRPKYDSAVQLILFLLLYLRDIDARTVAVNKQR